MLRKENTPPRLCLSGTSSCSICFSSIKLCRYALHCFLCVLYLARTHPFIAPLCPPSCRGFCSFIFFLIYVEFIPCIRASYYFHFFPPSFLPLPQLPVFPSTLTWADPGVHTARHCGKSAGVNGGTGRGIDGGARERRVGGALRKHSICCFPKAKIFP